MPDMHQGPIDMRPILPDDIATAQQRIGDHLREVQAAEGYRSLILHSMAAIAAAANVLTDVGAGGAALQHLKLCAAQLEARLPDNVVNPRKETIQ